MERGRAGEMSKRMVRGQIDAPGPAAGRRSRAATLGMLAVAAMLVLSACNSGQTAAGQGSETASTTVTKTVSPAGSEPSNSPVAVPPLTTTTAPAGPPESATQADPAVATDPPAPTTTHVPAPPARITTNVKSGIHPNPTRPVTVQASKGTLTKVRLINPHHHDRTVAGKITAHQHRWTSTQALSYSKGYRLSATAVNADGKPTTITITFKTPAPPARITTNVKSSMHPNPTRPITVKASKGTLKSVRLINPHENNLVVAGKFTAHRHRWTSTQVLGYDKSYRLSATAVNADGKPTTRTITFSTFAPDRQTMPSFYTTGQYPLHRGHTYGVGVIAIVHFDEPIAYKANAEKALHVTTSPHVKGSWYWTDSQNAHWRPRHFYAPGTKVTIRADVYGVALGPGLFGQSDTSTSFTIGRRRVTYAYDNAPHGVDKVVVKNGDGKTLRTMNTSMGKHGGVTLKSGKYINFYTMSGTYTVIAHENPAMMSSASYGLPANAPGGYKAEPIYWSTRISNGGIYLHELNSTIWAQNSGRDVSHGCLNLNTANAKWFYRHSIVGDPVIVKGAKGAPKIQLWQGGDWSVSWKTWLRGSALH